MNCIQYTSSEHIIEEISTGVSSTIISTLASQVQNLHDCSYVSDCKFLLFSLVYGEDYGTCFKTRPFLYIGFTMV